MMAEAIRDLSDVPTKQGIPRIAGNHWKLTRGMKQIHHHLPSSRRNQICPYLDFVLLASRTVRKKKSVVFKPHSLW